MKQNLETLKKILDEKAVWLEMPMTRKVIQWEGEFEKELRGWKTSLESFQNVGGQGKVRRKWMLKVLNEVLGVEPKVKEETEK